MNQRWINHFVALTNEKALMSRDENTKVGAVLVSEIDMVEISSGYNCLPRGVIHHKERSERPLKYSYTSHAEASAIANAARLGRATRDSTLFVSMFPCASCMCLIINAGISKIVSGKPDINHAKYGQDYVHSITMANEAGITICFEEF